VTRPKDADRPALVRLDEVRAAMDREEYPPPLDGGLATRAIHGGEHPGAPAVPIYPANAVGEVWAYSRYSNPTVKAFEANFRELEGGAGTVATASGMAAVSQTLLGLLRSGDRLVVHRSLFVGVRTLLQDFLPHYGIDVVAVDMRQPELLAEALEVPTKIVFFEPVTHPEVEVIDAPACLELVGRAGALAVVDNTFLTPCLFRPLMHGADVVVHSVSKYAGGHGDAIGGVVTARSEEVARRIRKARRILGGTLSPISAYFLSRGLKTLPLRMERHCANALRVATFLEGHPKIAEVLYPGLPSFPGHRTAASYLRAFGGVVCFRFAGGVDKDGVDKEKFGAALRLCKVRFSFGETETVVLLQDEVPLVRISVGLEDPEDVIADLARALEAC